MDFITVLMIAVGLSMDAVAVSICDGMSLKKIKWTDIAFVSGAFGVAQGLMPILGYFVGQTFSGAVSSYSNLIAFLLLAYIGVKMIIEGIPAKEEKCIDEEKPFITGKLILMQAIATSIDALAVGVSFAVIKIQIFPAAALIAIVTFALSAVGIWVGRQTGRLLKNKAEIGGGVILILIGLKILLKM